MNSNCHSCSDLAALPVDKRLSISRVCQFVSFESTAIFRCFMRLKLIIKIKIELYSNLDIHSLHMGKAASQYAFLDALISIIRLEDDMNDNET